MKAKKIEDDRPFVRITELNKKNVNLLPNAPTFISPRAIKLPRTHSSIDFILSRHQALAFQWLGLDSGRAPWALDNLIGGKQLKAAQP